MTTEHSTPARERAARAWRDAKDAREGWRAFKRWLARTKPDDDTSDAPYWTDGIASNHRLWTSPSPRGVLFFEKGAIMDAFLPDGRGSDRATRLGIATSVTPFAPSSFDHKLIRSHVRQLGGALGFVGDLDPHALHVFGAMCSGRLDAPRASGRKLAIDWLGIDDEWLRRARRAKRPMVSRFIRMGWIDREYWGVIKRFSPELRSLLGDESFALLESGVSAECHAFRDVMPAILTRRISARRR